MPREAKALFEKGEAVSLDVRTKDEYAGGHIASAANIDFYGNGFREDVSVLDKTKHYIVNCQSGGRSAKTVVLMNELGFEQVTNLDGGIMAWKSEGLPVER